MKRLVVLFVLNFFNPPCAQAQDTTALPGAAKQAFVSNHTDSALYPDSKKRSYLVAGIHAAGYAGTLGVLGAAWYKGYDRTSFHLFNDSQEWLQLDKAGHAWTAYTIAGWSAQLWEWSGMKHRKAALLGGFSALGYQTILEFLDAHSAKWGWSWADMGANAFGASLFTAQKLTWGTQKVAIKFSSLPQQYNAALQPRVNDLFGNTFAERLLKDYNAQTYWASVNLHSVFQKGVPLWLNIAIGYGAQGMYGGFENRAIDKNGAVVFDRRDIKRVRQWYLSPDIDWTKLKTNRKMVRTLFAMMNMIKLPAPALELRSGKLKPRWLAF